MKRVFFKSSLIFIFIYTIAGFLILPYYLQFSFSKYIEKNFSIQAYVDRIDFNPFTFEVVVGGFRLEDKKRKNLLFFETLHLNLELFDLLKKKIHLKHVKIDNFRIDIDLDKNKTPNFQYLLETFQNQNRVKKTQETKSGTMPSVKIGKLDLTYLNVLFTDNSKENPYTLITTPFDINLENISIDTNHINNIKFVIDTKESGTIALNSKLIVKPFQAYGDVRLSNINLNKKFDYLKKDDINFDLKSKRLNLSFGYKFEILDKNMFLNISDISLDVKRLELFKTMYAFDLNELKTKIKNIDFTIAKESQYILKDMIVDIQTIDLDDKNIAKSFTLKKLNLIVDKVSSKKDEAIGFTTSLKMPQEGSLDVLGKAVREPLNLSADIKLQNTDLRPYEKYIQQELNLGIDSFFVNLDSNLKYRKKENKDQFSLSGNGRFNNIALSNTQQKQKLLKIKSIDFKNIVYKDNLLKMSSIDLEKPFFYAEFNKDKTTNFTKLVKESNREKEDSKEAALKEKNDFRVMVKKLTIKEGNAEITDKTITPQFHTKSQEIDTVANNLSINLKEKTNITYKSIVDKYSPLRAEGVVQLEEPLEDLAVSVQVQNIDLPSLSMYSGKFLGNKIENGKLFLDLNHTIKKGELNSTNNIRIKDISLGEKVESKDAIDAPISLAIALLKDSKGMIDLDIPMKGDVKDPKFDISDAVSDVIINTIVGIVTAPFKFLALLVGLDGDQDISNAGFIYGLSEIDPTQKEKLDAIAKALNERPQLQIKIKPAYSLEDDKKALQEQKFQEVYPGLNDTSKTAQELYSDIKKEFIKLYTKKEYQKLKGKEDSKYLIMLKKLQESIKVEVAEIELLANNRAHSVQEYLIVQGVDKERIKLLKSYTTDKIDKKLNQVIVLFELDAK